jgi:hypothetical protein
MFNRKSSQSDFLGLDLGNLVMMYAPRVREIMGV